MTIYRDLIIELYKNPLNKRTMKNAQIAGSGANPLCGDHVRIYAKTNKNNIIQDSSFEGDGCAISIAAASFLTENAKGKTFDEILKWNSRNVFSWLGSKLSPTRLKCGILSLETMQEAIERYNRKTAKS